MLACVRGNAVLGDGLDCCAVGRVPWISHLEKRGFLLHGGFSLNNLMGRGVNVA
ncbi:hypothetical protein [Bartonella sp. B1098]|uniref:hypothetical protein n=1 Tax=Bartonella sp. B1098 TaxID=2911421 RepID=UPI0020C1DF5B|nr:hypothetical protein [Bartonella sp. B1098]